jgi:endonuclease/exonuclease/phosphatase family metal-dependent hydrolase
VVDAHRLAHPTLLDTLHGSDVVCLQELFLGDAEDFFDNLAHPHKHRDRNRATWKPLSICGSGLGVASRYPLVAREVSAYPGRQVHSERLARKGALHVRVDLGDGLVLDVVNTHLQSGYGGDAVAVRATQLAHLRAVVDRVGAPERACLIVGDLNIDGLGAARKREYAALRALFSDFEDLGPDAPTFAPHPTQNVLAWRFEPHAPAQRLDYILLRTPCRGAIRVRDVALCLVESLSPLKGPATHPSDHFGLRVVLDL